MFDMLINLNNTPEIMMDAFEERPYIKAGAADYSATSLIEPPQIVQLKKRHGDKIEVDAMSRWSMFLGNALHEKLERELGGKPQKYILERKFMDILMDRKIVAKIDAYDVENDILYDHKSCKTWAYTNDIKTEWEQQLNINAWFLRKDGFNPAGTVVNALMVDWSAGMLKRDKAGRYPPNPMAIFYVPLWSFDEQDRFIKDRLALHIAAEQLPDDRLPECTLKEMWAVDDVYAVRAPNRYASVRNLPSMEEAERFITEHKRSDLTIECVPGMRRRCELYCDVKPFCKQYEKYARGLVNEDSSAIDS